MRARVRAQAQVRERARERAQRGNTDRKQILDPQMKLRNRRRRRRNSLQKGGERLIGKSRAKTERVGAVPKMHWEHRERCRKGHITELRHAKHETDRPCRWATAKDRNAQSRALPQASHAPANRREQQGTETRKTAFCPKQPAQSARNLERSQRIAAAAS
jgi:hypothetical protein